MQKEKPFENYLARCQNHKELEVKTELNKQLLENFQAKIHATINNLRLK